MIHITQHAKGNKMEGFIAISTSTLENKFCQSMQKKDDLICKQCYAIGCEKRYTNLNKALVRNHVLGERPLTVEEIKELRIAHKYVRFNSFGELINKQHMKNLVAIANYYKDSNFTLWTKRINLVKGIEIPSNMFLIYSSPKINVISDLPEGFDKVFTVFKPAYARENNIEINCPKQCIDCLKCYTKNSITHIYENSK